MLAQLTEIALGSLTTAALYNPLKRKAKARRDAAIGAAASLLALDSKNMNCKISWRHQ